MRKKRMMKSRKRGRKWSRRYCYVAVKAPRQNEEASALDTASAAAWHTSTAQCNMFAQGY